MLEKHIAINEDWRVARSNATFILQHKYVNTKGAETWGDKGYHATVLQALGGYVRHSMDYESDIASIVLRMDTVESDVRNTKRKKL